MRTEIDLNESEMSLNESEIDLNKCEMGLNESEIDLNECDCFLKANLHRSQIDATIQRQGTGYYN